jgi:RNA-binding protein
MATPEKLPGKQLRYLRSLAHALKPVVQLGKQGFSAAVSLQIDQALTDHELIKVKIGGECPDKIPDVAKSASEKLGAHVAQTIGATLVLYRRHPQEPKIQLPKGK